MCFRKKLNSFFLLYEAWNVEFIFKLENFQDLKFRKFRFDVFNIKVLFQPWNNLLNILLEKQAREYGIKIRKI